MRLAVIDIGTLTCRVLVASYIPGSTRDAAPSFGSLDTVYAGQKIVWLGEGVDRTGRILPAAASRAIEAILEWKAVIDRLGVERHAAVATSAVRAARNRMEFVRRVRRDTGVEVDVLDGAEEAGRICTGIRIGLPPDAHDVLGLDIGGGSTEFIVSRSGRPPRVASVEMGVVRLTERTLHGDPPRAEDVRHAETMVRKLTRGALRKLGDVTGLTLVATAGTVISLAAMARALSDGDAARRGHDPLTLPVVRRIERDVFRVTRAARTGMPGLEPGREAVIPAGSLMLRCIMEELRRERCVVSEYGLREGALVHLALAGRSGPGPRSGRVIADCTSESPAIPGTRGGERRRVFPGTGL